MVIFELVWFCFRLEYEYIVKGYMFQKGRLKITVSKIYKVWSILHDVSSSHGSVSVFQVGIGFSVYRLVFFQAGSVFVVGISKYCNIGLVFSVFHFASKRRMRILKFCFRVNPQILTEDPCPCSH